MSNVSREDQINELAKAMSTMPGLDGKRTPVTAPARRLWATDLIDHFGVSIDPSKATKPPTPSAQTTAAYQGNVAYVQRAGPAFLAANNPDLATRLRLAKTPAQKDALAAELRDKILNNPSTLVTEFVGLLTAKMDEPPTS